MDFQELMLTYGYPILFLGVLLESEAFLLVGVYLANQGYFSLPAVIALAALSSFCITQFCFWLGCRYGSNFIRTRPRWQLRYQRIERLTNRYGTGLVIGFRALYGLRGAVPAAVGLAGFSSARFMVFNALGALVWALVVALLSSNLVQGFNQLYESLPPSETMALYALAAIIGLGLVFQWVKRSRLKRQTVNGLSIQRENGLPLPVETDSRR
ncbi:DedA family protein [Spirosoma foliorum]|uniref:DedA family protein n=1 Tax=Spirosoma foliorum TaxID=2710596 RepID=A0A7G5H391_9BACT|nr:DedA family protein [Spirosoma foliorum]QMW05583.1 DedA family protein [Spirosoma foliorum]